MASSIATVRTAKDLRAQVAKWRQAGETVALVPTMGALHAGHLSLIGIAKGQAGRVVASIFVNPSQFGPKEDFKRYPRDEAGDVKKLAEADVDLVFLPSTDEMYPAGFSTKVSLPNLTDDLCGAARPNHFEGVATVVTKLLLQCAPDVAVFGEKDFQQLMVIMRLAADLDLPVKIVGALIVREKSGLAMSSRNAYLTEAQRGVAATLHRVLKDCAGKIAGKEQIARVLDEGSAEIESVGFTLDYFEARNADSLAKVETIKDGPLRLLVAARLGSTRLIDNIAV
jgi:pantoate--beta-alanine ligase